MKKQTLNGSEKKRIDWMITLVPLAIVVGLGILFFFLPEQSNVVINQIRHLLGDTFGTYYLVIGLGIFLVSLFIACSKYGDIVLGEKNEKPKYSFFAWGSMMFTAGLAADILFYSFSEWILYATDPHIAQLGSIEDWSSVYPIFHWSLIPWGFYLVLAVAFGFMLHVRNRDRHRHISGSGQLLGCCKGCRRIVHAIQRGTVRRDRASVHARRRDGDGQCAQPLDEGSDPGHDCAIGVLHRHGGDRRHNG